MLCHRLLRRRPEPDIAGGCTGERMRDGVVREALDRVSVRVLEDALGLGRPNNNGLVRPARRKPLPVPRVRHRIQHVLVPLERRELLAARGVVEKDAVAARDDEARAVGGEGHVVHRRLHPIPLLDAVGPRGDRAHHSGTNKRTFVSVNALAKTQPLLLDLKVGASTN